MKIPKESFFRYQRRWLDDPARFKIGLWARQTGKDYTCAAEAVFDCTERPKTHWVIVAAGERQAMESLEKAREWAQKVKADWRERSGEIRFGNGSRITALPGKPETIRGYSANVILTEFAFHDDPPAIWRAVFPMVTNSLRGGEKKLRVITTPNGQGNFFHQMWLNESGGFTKHRVTIHEAKAEGLPINIEALRNGLGDGEAWAQEYECEFLDGSTVLLPYELIEECEAEEATESSTPQLLSEAHGEVFAGIDFGRKHDLTVCWLIEKVAPLMYVTREVLVLEKMPTPAQFEVLRPRVARARRVCVDYTGAGVGLGDLLVQEFGSAGKGVKFTHGLAFTGWSKIELCQFSGNLKQEIFPLLRAAFERGLIRIPRSTAIREDLHAMHKVVTQCGQVSYRATHSADGHSDRCTALALALRAAEQAPKVTLAGSVDVPRRRMR